MESLSSLNVFVHVAETRSFVAAGRILGVSASAVGKSIARMETKLKVRLFHRSTRSVTLTAEGALFLERSRRIVAELEAAESELSQLSENPRGRLRLSLPLVSTLLLPVLGEFMRRYPDIELDLDFTDRVVDVVEEGFDAVVRTGQMVDSRLSMRKLGNSVICWSGLLPILQNTAGRVSRRICSRIAACISAIPTAASWSRGRFRRMWMSRCRCRWCAITLKRVCVFRCRGWVSPACRISASARSWRAGNW